MEVNERDCTKSWCPSDTARRCCRASLSGLRSVHWGQLMRACWQLLLHPIQSWESIKAEQRGFREAYLFDLLVLAALGPIAQFVKMITVGEAIGLRRVTWSFFPGLGAVFLSYCSSLLSLAVIAVMFSRLASRFGAVLSFDRSAQMVFFASLPVLLASVAQIIPGLSLVIAAFAVYSVFLLWNGVAVMSGVSLDKRSPYFAIALGAACFAMACVSVLLLRFS